MFALTTFLILSFTLGFAFPPLWIITFLCARQIIRIGHANHAARYRAEQMERMKNGLWWSK